MTSTARVAANIDATLLEALMTQAPIPGDGVDGLVTYIAARHPTVPRAHRVPLTADPGGACSPRSCRRRRLPKRDQPPDRRTATTHGCACEPD
jgi:hypothetical protein